MSPVFAQIPASKLNNPHSLVREGELLYRQQELSLALEYFQKAADTFAQRGDKVNQAITLSNLGRLQLELGKANDALNNWVTAKNIYIQLGDKTGITRSQIYQAHGLQKLGFYPRACGILLQTLEISESNCEALTKNKLDIILGQNQENIQQPDSLLLTAWRKLGDTLRVIGKLEESRLVLEKIAQIDSSPTQAATLLSLGNTFADLGDLERDRQLARFSVKYDYQPWVCQLRYVPLKAKKLYKKAEDNYKLTIAKVPSTTTAIQAKINLLNLLLKTKNSSEAETLLSEINISNLPQNKTQVYTQINLAKSSACLAKLKSNQPDWIIIAKQLESAKNKAEKIGDNRAKSYALGNLGGLYEFYAWWLEKNPSQAKTVKDNLCQTVNDCRQKAQKLTESALYLAQPKLEPFIAYRLQSQLGRLLDKQGKRDDAITAYEEGIKTLDSVRDNLLVIDSQLQFSFLEDIEPVYRRLLELLLQPQAREDGGDFFKAIDISEKLQLAEIENFLRCRLDLSKTIKPTELNQFEKPAAIIHPIILKDRVEVIVQIPTKGNSSKIDRKTLKFSNQGEDFDFYNLILSLRKTLKDKDNPIGIKRIKDTAKNFYNLLVKPAISLPDFPESGTLLFIVDSTLQGIPFAALNDGKHYLIEKYSIVTNSTSELLKSSNLKPEKRNALLAGISKQADSFTKYGQNNLPNIKQELEDIQKTVKSKVIENEEFTKKALEKEINAKPFSMVHLATHGKFASNREETHIYAWDEKIKLDELDKILSSRRETNSQPIELLVLSACQTAEGDKRAALGIAGVALKAEARSTLATLWQVNDASTAKFIKLFYQELSKPNMTKAEALRKVQIHFLKNEHDEHPYYWAPFILVGNWL